MSNLFFTLLKQRKIIIFFLVFVFSRSAASIEFSSSDSKDLYSQLHKQNVEMSAASVDSVRMAIKEAKVEAATISFHCSRKKNELKCYLSKAEGIIYPKFE
ncbi:MAG: hypothetical protein QE271_05300 [Bacteriovoracaceae bacterium]|nr:hypothetical protein [Bacteriovoracaceae bacterium]